MNPSYAISFASAQVLTCKTKQYAHASESALTTLNRPADISKILCSLLSAFLPGSKQPTIPHLVDPLLVGCDVCNAV